MRALHSSRSGVLVDSTSFRMNPASMDGPWRDANINLIGPTPANEAPGTFPTGYFGTRDDALKWLAVAVRLTASR
jgi:hypothetical protein